MAKYMELTERIMEINRVFYEDLQDILYDSNIDFQKLKNCSVLVTGVTGLIGSLTVKALIYANEALKLNLRIIGIVRNENKIKDIYKGFNLSIVDFVHGDVAVLYTTYLNDNVDIDYVIHAASITASKIMISQPVETILTSVEGTNQMLRLATDKKVKSMVFISSMEMYGSFNNSDFLCTEEKIGYIDPLKVRSNYPEAKRMCENLCIAYSNEYGVPVKIARLSQTFGAGILPWENRVFAQFCSSVREKKDIILHTSGLSEGNYCYTSDAIRGILTILLKGKDCEAYNVVNENTHTTILEMAQMICCEIANKQIDVIVKLTNDNYGYAPETKLKLSGEKLMSLGWLPKWNLKDMYIRTLGYLDLEENRDEN